MALRGRGAVECAVEYSACARRSANTDHTYTLGSLDRFKNIAANLKATVVIQHDERDVGKLPVFPASAK